MSRGTTLRRSYHSALAIVTGLTLRAVFRLALRQTEGLIGSIIRLLGLDLAIPDHLHAQPTSRALEIVRAPANAQPVHLLVDSTGLKLSGALASGWSRSMARAGVGRGRKLHIGVDVDTGQIVAAALTTNDVDDGSQASVPLLDQIDRPTSPLSPATARYDQEGVYGEVASPLICRCDGHRATAFKWRCTERDGRDRNPHSATGIYN